MSLSANGRLPVPRLTPELLNLVKTARDFQFGHRFSRRHVDAGSGDEIVFDRAASAPWR